MAEAIRIAAIQLRAKVGDVADNLSHAESLARQAFRDGAQWVILPEFFTSPAAFSPAMLSAWLPLEGPALEMLRKLSRKHDSVIGGSFLAKSGDDCFNSFLLVFPDGRYYRHDKDLPTMWENSYYIGGSDDGVLRTPAGPVGAALCWELIRSRTARRLLGKVDLVVGGSCWWDVPLPVAPEQVDDQARLRGMLRQAPGELARRLGVPVVHAAQAGEFIGLIPGVEGRTYDSRFLGEAQIVDGHGNVLARLADEDGEGIVTAEIAPGRVQGDLAPIPDDFWTVEIPSKTLERWDAFNDLGRTYYATTFRPLLHADSRPR
ncbi:carbon-nitrogen hydrolase family protein [Paludisphaera rhizosphaerae]|uniref:carbon-nitrogen hydrolase family protein n=1 Tax=Paludisphaera rhizosphaerae TaxID=2711216 RepID=UPI0013EC7815|nr:carbon-nitrogen hydrolase family protein [Paludisphaera rhizosphaerae]